MTDSSHEKHIEASVYGIGLLDAQITRIEREVAELRQHRDHLMMLGKFNRVPIKRMAEACGITVRAVYQAIDRAAGRDNRS